MTERSEIAASAAALMMDCRTAALATVDAGGAPFSSFVAVAPDADASVVLLLSTLAVHTGNLAAEARASLLVVGEPPADDPLTVARLSLVGRVEKAAEAAQAEAARARYLAVHPAAEAYAGFGDFAFYRMTVRSGHFVAGFGRIVDLSADELCAAIG